MPTPPTAGGSCSSPGPVPRPPWPGLLFVAMSINLERILQGAGLPGRAGEVIVLLVAVLVVSVLGLVPGQTPTVLGAELLGAGLVAWLTLVAIDVRALRSRVGPSPGVLAGRVVITQAAVLPLLAGEVSLLLRAVGGLYRLVPGVVMCLAEAALGHGHTTSSRAVREAVTSA